MSFNDRNPLVVHQPRRELIATSREAARFTSAAGMSPLATPAIHWRMNED